MKKILIANRGEIASRIIRTCKKLGIETIAVHSEADQSLPFVRNADTAVCIGKGPVSQSYLNVDLIIEIAKEYNADAIHPGYGLLSENSDFAKRIEAEGIIFIGPNANTIALMGDKIMARQAMDHAGVPVVPGSDEEVLTASEAIERAEAIGFPIMLKASGGGGGIGMMLCHTKDDVEKTFNSVKQRAKSYFGSEKIFIEKYIENARHIEVQVFGDKFGNIVHLFERDCSVQRRNQKVIEETHSPFLSKAGREKIYDAAIKAAKAVGYFNAGTIEFIVDENENFYFLEMNTRLQVEHPITEMVTGFDLVELQIKVAAGEQLPVKQDEIFHSGASIEFRVYAENPVNFYPSPGTISKLSWGKGSARIDSGYEEGNIVTPFYDPLIAKCIFYGKTREDCIKTAKQFFETSRIEGIQTNIPLFIQILSNDHFLKGQYSTNLLKNMLVSQ